MRYAYQVLDIRKFEEAEKQRNMKKSVSEALWAKVKSPTGTVSHHSSAGSTVEQRMETFSLRGCISLY